MTAVILTARRNQRSSRSWHDNRLKVTAGKTRFKFGSVGEIFRREAKNRNLSLEQFGKLSESDLSIDADLDRKMIASPRKRRKL